MDKISHLLLLVLLLCLSTFAILPAPSNSEPTDDGLQPQPNESFNLSLIQNVGSCSYTVIVSTSCSSPRYTRDEISLAFGDAYGNQIYAPRIDDPSTRTFERCSSDTFQITGPCAYQLCYAYVYRTGPDGWMPETVKIYGYNSRTVTFVYNTYVPSAVWFGFNLCQNTSSSFSSSPSGLLAYLILLAAIGCLLL